MKASFVFSYLTEG